MGTANRGSGGTLHERALLVAWSAETELFVTPKLWIAGVLVFLAFGSAAVHIIAPFLARGTTLSAMLYMSVLQHKDSVKDWYFSLRVALNGSLSYH